MTSELPAESSSSQLRTGYDAVVVGAGFAGLCMLHRLRQLGMSVRVFEKGDGVGGTWYWNRYPGARVDYPSLEYSFSFSPELEQEWRWAEMYSPQAELERYANHVADRFGLRRDIQLGTTVVSASYDEAGRVWRVTTDRGDEVTAHYLITAVGCLSATNVPDMKGLDSFQGAWCHTSRWPKAGVTTAGKRVGVIGTGSTGIQAIPALAEDAGHLYVFQRTPQFSLPTNNHLMDPDFEAEWKRDYARHREAARWSASGREPGDPPTRSALEVPDQERTQIYEAAWGRQSALMRAFKDISSNLEANETAADFVRTKIRQIVRDPEVAERLCPYGYPIGARRICIDTGNYYATYNRENVTLVDIKSDPIVEIIPSGIRTESRTYELDVIVFATGFDAFTGPLLRMNVTGSGGEALAGKWQAGPVTYLGLATAGFPNMFTITGPGSPSALSNVITSIEQHVEWIGDAIGYLRSHGMWTMEASAAAEQSWTTHVNEAAGKTLRVLADSWQLGANIPGKPRVFLAYVGGVGAYRKKCAAVAEQGYDGFILNP